MNKLILLILAALSLVGCASTSNNISPNSAMVGGSFHREGLTVWRRVELISIDNKPAPYGFFQSGVDAKVPITPGSHSFITKVTISQGLTGGQYESIVDVRATVRAGMSYQLNGSINGARISAWLEDAAGRKVSGVASGAYHSASVNNVTFVPIVTR